MTRNAPNQEDVENQDQLCNLADDPGETKKLGAKRPDVVRRLSELSANAKQDNHTRP